MEDDSAPVDCVPLVGRVPLQPPEALQVVASVELQTSVDAAPLATDAGLAVRVTVGTTGGPTATVALACALPPAPVHVRLYVVAAASAAVDSLPVIALVPLQPPEALQAVAFVELQVSVEELPVITFVGLAANDTVGAAGEAPLDPAAPESPPPPHPHNTSIPIREAVASSDRGE